MSQKQLFATIPPVRIKFEKEQVAELLPLIDCVLDDPNDSIVIGQLLPGSYGQFRGIDHETASLIIQILRKAGYRMPTSEATQ